MKDMKTTIKNTALIIFSAAFFSSCLQEALPSSGAIAEQIQGDASSVRAQVNSIPAAMFRFGSSYASCGYPGIMLMRDAMTADFPVYDNTYDYYGYYVGATQYLGDYDVQSDQWTLYVKLIASCNNVISMCDPDNLTESLAGFLGNALTYRAFAYLDMTRMYEYRKTGVTSLDSRAQENKIYGLTVPIVTEKTTLTESRNNPRAEFWKMYRFILTDLNDAVDYLSSYKPSEIIYADATVAHGLLARLWLEIGTRFDNYPSDLAEALSHEGDPNVTYDKLGINSAKEAFAKAAEHAKLAQAGHSPLTQDEWMNPETGFNTAPKTSSAWLWGMSIGTDDSAVHSWKSWIPEISPEVSYGVVFPLNAYRMIDARLYSGIPDSDWRKLTWINPDDAGKESAYSKYKTNLSTEAWVTIPAYTGFKFRPAQGDIDTYTTGTAVSIPLMRVEEMMLIEAEALGRSVDVGTGKSALIDFVKTYRDPDYTFGGATVSDLVDEIFRQKRIELWGEGIIMFEYKRLQKAVTRKYSGTNFLESHQLNSPDDVVARWLNFYITSNEYQYNNALRNTLNPDPSFVSDYEY